MNNQQRLKSQHPDVLRLKIQQMSDQEVTQRFAQELLKLKTLNQYGRYSEHFLGYPNTLIMNRCRRELQRRSLPVPLVNPAGKDEDNAVPRETAPGESDISARKDGNT